MALKVNKGAKTSEWGIARTGISLFLNNKMEEAEALFTGHPDSFRVKVGRCFVLFMNAVMSFEDDKFQRAMLLLKEVERECANDIGWLKSMKNRVFRSDDSSKEYVDKLERQIVLADTQVGLAVLTLLRQELTSYVRGGWMLSKAWRVYQHVYVEISELYRRTFGTIPSDLDFDVNCAVPVRNGSCDSLQSPHSPGSSEWSIPSDESPKNATSTSSPSGLRSSLSMLFSLTGITSEEQTPFVEPSEVARLMSAVCFGYGIYQLCVSLLPSSMLTLVHFLGFDGDRQAGLDNLMYARVSEDMRAPLATLSLLWYHTFVQSSFGFNSKAGVVAAKRLIEESRHEFEHSALFLFFIGRLERLQSNVGAALGAYGRAVKASSQREVRLLCLHEVAWCHLIRLSYEETYRSLTELREQSRWSKRFYAYLAAVCCGSTGKFEELTTIYRKILQVETAKDTQLGFFILRRTRKLVDEDTDQTYTDQYYRLLVYELLYLWNAMPFCSIEALERISLDCKSSHSEEPMIGLSYLIKGAAYSYLGNREASITCFRNCLKRRERSKANDDRHITAFALYELGRSLCLSDNVEEGKRLLLIAQTKFRDCDFESRLSVNIHAALREIIKLRRERARYVAS